ncbi:hypothetical protein OA101_02595 [Alphaproteobacteria bacterium]|nr:hypothetical protein [Alphaproteobacteria bacterium]
MPIVITAYSLAALLLVNQSAQAGAWLRPQYEAELFLKFNHYKDNSPGIRLTEDLNQLEAYTEIGLFKKLTLAMTRSGPMRSENRPSQNGPKTEFEFITYPPYFSGGLFPPYSENLMKLITGLPVTRELKMSIGIGATRLREYRTQANYDTYFRTSIALGDTISFGKNKILAHSTIAGLQKRDKENYDARVSLEYSRSKYAIGYEYGYYYSNNKVPSYEDVFYIETPIYELPASLRFSVSKKKSEFYSHQKVFSIWLRYPFRTKPKLTHYTFDPIS